MKVKELITKVLVGNPKTIVSVFAMMLLISGIHGITHADSPQFPISETGKRTIREDASAGAFINPAVRATDADRGDTLTYELSGIDEAYFEIVETSGRLKLKLEVDFEDPGDAIGAGFVAEDNKYEVTVTVTDNDDGIATKAVTITVIDVNEAPMFGAFDSGDPPRFITITKAERMVNEHTEPGQNIGPPILATDPDGDDTHPDVSGDNDLIFALTGTDARHFEIDPNTGQLKTKTALNFEAPIDTGGTRNDNFYTVTVTVKDSPSRGITRSLPVTIEVTDVNERPEFPASTTPRTVREHQPAGTPVGTQIKATDPDDDTLTYAFMGIDDFVIESTTGQLKTTKPLDYEQTKVYTITIKATDDGDRTPDDVTDDNLDSSITVTINVINANDPPEITTAETGFTVAENRVGTFGAPILATDPDPDNDTLTFGLVDIPGNDHAEHFSINARTGQLSTKKPLDFEAEDKPTGGYMVRVTVRDSKDENGDADTKPDDTHDITITVMEVNEPPMFPSSAVTLSLYEGSGSITVQDPNSELTAMDPDANDTLTYSLSGPDASTFTVGTGTLSASDLTYATDKRSYRVTVIATDSAGLTDLLEVTLRLLEVTPADEGGTAPVFDSVESTDLLVREDTKGLIGRFRATDADGDTLTYEITTTNTNLFRVDNTGRLYNKELLDFDSPPQSHTVTVKVTDGADIDTINVTITVVQVNEPPVFGTTALPIMSAVLYVAENADAGTDLAATMLSLVSAYPLPAVDPDLGDSPAYTLSGYPDAASFAINADGQLSTRVKLDYETKSTYNVTVSASDSNNPPVTIPVTIIVVDANDAPMFTAGARVTRTMGEDISIGTNVGLPVAATDQDRDDVLTYTISTGAADNPDRDKFTIREPYGQLYYTGMTDHTVDFEGDTPFYQIKVEVTDDSEEGDTNSDSIIVLIEVTDVDEPPMFTDADPVTRSVNENQVARYPVGARILAIDPEDKALTYQLDNVPGSTDAASFTIDASGHTAGQLRTRAPLDQEAQEMYEVMVSVTDGVKVTPKSRWHHHPPMMSHPMRKSRCSPNPPPCVWSQRMRRRTRPHRCPNRRK